MSVMEYNSTLNIDGEKVRSLREEQELTQLYLATAVGVTTETISRWERRRYPAIKRGNALKLAEALNVSLEMILETSGAADEPEPMEKGTAGSGAVTVSRLPPRWLQQKSLLFCAAILLASLTFWLLLPVNKDAGIRAVRYLPAQVMPGQVFPVLIRVDRLSEDTSFLLRETLPEFCSPVRTLPPSLTHDDNTRQIKWIKRGHEQGQENFYYLTVLDKGAAMDSLLFFQGAVVVGRRGSQEPVVSGVLQTEVTPFHWADENRDNRIDDYEMLSVYELFPEGEALGIDIKEIEAIWAASGYRWSGAEAGITIISKKQGDEPGIVKHQQEE